MIINKREWTNLSTIYKIIKRMKWDFEEDEDFIYLCLKEDDDREIFNYIFYSFL